jgi:hypothetical protein
MVKADAMLHPQQPTRKADPVDSGEVCHDAVRAGSSDFLAQE